MYTLGAVLCVLALLGGLWLIWYGWRDRRDPLRPRKIQSRKPVSRSTKLRLAAAAVAGLLAWVITGWFLLLPAAIGIAVAAPKMFARRESEIVIARLAALEEWLRRLVGLLNVGVGLEQAIGETRKTIPRELQPEIRQLISRLATNHPARAALLEFADALDDATGDLVCSALMISSNLRASGLPKALKDFADTVAGEVADRRQVEVDRRSPRMQARMVTGILVLLLVYLFVFTDYMAPYRQPGMQLVLVALMTVFAGLLAYIAHLTRPVRPPRFLREETARPTTKWWKPRLLDQSATAAHPGAVATLGGGRP